MQRGTANYVAICSKPFKTQGCCQRERQRGGQSRSWWQGTMNTKKVEPKRNISDPRRKQSRLRANVKSDETERRMAQWWTSTKQAALSQAISLREKASGLSQSVCVRNCTRGLTKDWMRKAQRTVWTAVWIVEGDISLRPSQRFWRKSRRTTSQDGNVEFQQHTKWIRSVAWQMEISSWPRRRTGRHRSSWRATKDPGRCERPYAGGRDHLLEAQVHCRVVINFQQTLSKERTITNVSDWKADAAARQAASFEFSPQIVWSTSARWQMGMPSCLRSGKRTPPSFWPSTRPHGGGGCSHLYAAQVHDGTVIKFLQIASTWYTSSASMNSGKIRQRDTARVLCKERKTAPLEKTAPGLGSSPSCRRCHSPPPTTSNDAPLSGIKRRLILNSAKTASVHLHPSLPSVAADEQSTKGRECAPLEINVWSERDVVRATKGAQNIITAKERER